MVYDVTSLVRDNRIRLVGGESLELPMGWRGQLEFVDLEPGANWTHPARLRWQRYRKSSWTPARTTGSWKRPQEVTTRPRTRPNSRNRQRFRYRDLSNMFGEDWTGRAGLVYSSTTRAPALENPRYGVERPATPSCTDFFAKIRYRNPCNGRSPWRSQRCKLLTITLKIQF